MSYDDKSVFTFNLNESLWFKKGQEVDEIMGISLEPEISIQELDDHISVRGVIELKGEYFQVRDESHTEDEDQVLSMRDHPSHRFVDRVESYEDGVNEFFHNFPVEVSIPTYRIDDLDNVMVGIESFDYELPENSQLKLHATVAIHGVNNGEVESQTMTSAEQREDQLTPLDDPIEEPPEPPVDETFTFDFKEPQGVEKDSEVPRNELPTEQEAVSDLDEEIDEPVEEEESGELEAAADEEPEAVPEDNKKEKERWKYKKSQSLAEFFGQKEVKEEVEEESVDDSEEYYESSEMESSIINFNANVKEESSDEFMESSREAEQEDSTYLLNIFDDKEEENRYSSLKMCIVQESDTIETIAEKYDISPLHISKRNNLLNDELSEGQILYIPTKNKKVT